MIVLIATTGPTKHLQATLESIAAAIKPAGFGRVVVIENGHPGEARSICRRVRDRYRGELNIQFESISAIGKSNALNHGLRFVEDDNFVFMTDDDIQFSSDIFCQYERTRLTTAAGCFFGGPFDVRYEVEPPDWLLPYLPPSARGWHPDYLEFDAESDFFMGCNWAAYAGDLKRVGGFDPRFGPGSPTGATGQERQMQRRLIDAGLRPRYVTGAVVSHYVPVERCTPDWAIRRGHRCGVARGLANASRGTLTRLHDHTLNGLRLAYHSAGNLVSQASSDDLRAFKAKYYSSRSLGYFKGVRQRDAA